MYAYSHSFVHSHIGKYCYSVINWHCTGDIQQSYLHTFIKGYTCYFCTQYIIFTMRRLWYLLIIMENLVFSIW